MRSYERPFLDESIREAVDEFIATSLKPGLVMMGKIWSASYQGRSRFNPMVDDMYGFNKPFGVPINKVATRLGAKAGLWASISLLTILIAIVNLIGYLDGDIQFLVTFSGVVVLYFLLIGLVPALLIGALTGRIFASAYLRVEEKIFSIQRSMTLGVVLGLLIALPLISILTAFSLSLIFRVGIDIETILILMLLFAPFCIGARLYIGQQLHRETQG